MKNNNSIDDLFREKLQDFQQSPRPGLFDEVLSGIAAGRRRRKLLYWRMAGIAAALLLAFVGGWQFSNRNRELTTPPVYADQNSSTGDQKTISTPENKEIASAGKNIEISKAENGDKSALLTDATAAQKANQTFASLTGSAQKVNTLPSLGQNSEQLRTIIPMKSLFRLLEQTKAQNKLREKIALEARSEKLARSIDQQIMEQNQKNYLAELMAKQRGRWLLGAQVSPAYNLDHGSYSQTYATNMISASSMNPIDLGGGLSVEYKTSKRLSLQTGVYYATIGQSSGNSSHSLNLDIVAGSNGSNYFNTPVSIQSDKVLMNSSAGVIEIDQVPESLELGASMDNQELSSTVLVSDARFMQNFQYIEVPLYLRYALFGSRFDVEMLGGFSTNFLIGNDAYLQNGSAKSLIGTTQGMRTFNYSGTLGIGLKYGLSKHFYLNVEPRVKYFLNSLNTNSSVKYRPYIFGIYTGVSYEF